MKMEMLHLTNQNHSYSMAKELPYFQFETSQYLTGTIQFCSYEEQGVFINVCSIYWERRCESNKDQLIRKFGSDHINRLIAEKVIKCDDDGDITIDFLDKQWESIMRSKTRLSEAGKKGVLAKKEATLKPPLSHPIEITKQPDKIREDKKIDDTLVITDDQYATIEKSIKGITDFIKTNKPRFITPYTDLWNLFSEKYGTAKVKAETETRKKKIKIRTGEPNFDFPEILKKSTEQKFALESAWFNFDFLIENDTNYMKVLEGKYIQKQVEQPQKPTQSISRPNYE